MIRTLVLPIALVAGLGFASAGKAEASPVTTFGAHVAHAPLGGVHIGVGGGVSFPIGGYGPSGYWTTQTVPVTVPVTVAYQVADHVIGSDMYGNPIWAFRTEYRTEYRTQWVTQQVWVNTGYRPWGFGGLGFGFRIR